MDEFLVGPESRFVASAEPSGSSKCPLTLDLAPGVLGVGTVPFAPALIAAAAAVRDPTVPMPDDVGGSQRMSTGAERSIPRRRRPGTACDTQVIDIHAPRLSTGVLKSRSKWDWTAAALVDPQASGGDGRARRPPAVAAGVALDPLGVAPTVSAHEPDAKQPPAVRGRTV